MSDEKQTKAETRKAILEHLNKLVESKECDDLMMQLIGIQINSKENECEKEVVVCEDENGTTVMRVRSDSYEILDVNPDWADSSWWDDNALVSLKDATLAIAYDYLIQEGVPDCRTFADENDAMHFVYDNLLKLDTNDDFVKRIVVLLLDFDSSLGN